MIPRRLGQHFLKDEAVLSRAAAVLNVETEDAVIEIGPGHGELTKYLLKRGPRRVIVIEKDKKLADELFKNLGLSDNHSDLRIVYGDALTCLLQVINEEKLANLGYKIAGNIPYYITGHLLRVISELERKPALVSLVVQKEVAERISSKPPEMNLLAASVGFWAEPKILSKISAKKFKPAPKVDSALLLLKTLKKSAGVNADDYYRFIRKLFKQPRKTILNNLSEGLPIDGKEAARKKIADLKIDPGLRPQTLNINKLEELTSVFS